MTDCQPTQWQSQVLTVPEEFDLALLGGRGGGKSAAIAFLILRHCETYGSRARCLYVRQTHRATEDFAALTRQLFGAAYGKAARFNSVEGTWRLPNGGYVELAQLSDANGYQSLQGRSFSLIAVDEVTQYADPQLIDMLRSNLRAPGDAKPRFIIAGNPGCVGQAWVARRYIFGAPGPWKPFVEQDSGRTFVLAPSVHSDNPTLSGDYVEQLRAACASDPELLKAWLEGDFTAAKGAYFGSVLSEKRSAIDADAFPPGFHKEPPPPRNLMAWREKPADWRLFLSHDYGSSAPSVTYVVAKSPGAKGPDGVWYPRDSFLLLDELATNAPGSLTQGLGWTIPTLAEAIHELANRWKISPNGIADDAIFAAHGHGGGSIADEFRREKIYLRKARKGTRVAGWQRMRRLLEDAGKPDVPGLYISRACSYFWDTAPYAARDPRRPDDVDSRGPDHGLDAARYACLETGERVSFFGAEWV